MTHLSKYKTDNSMTHEIPAVWLVSLIIGDALEAASCYPQRESQLHLQEWLRRNRNNGRITSGHRMRTHDVKVPQLLSLHRCPYIYTNMYIYMHVYRAYRHCESYHTLPVLQCNASQPCDRRVATTQALIHSNMFQPVTP